MSYILDALTKLDQERQRARAPDLYAHHATIESAKQNHSRWLYVLGGALSAAILTVLSFQFWKGPGENPPPQQAALQSSNAKPNPPAGRMPHDSPLGAMQPDTGREASGTDQVKPTPQSAAATPAAKILPGGKLTPVKADQPKDASPEVTQRRGAQVSSRPVPRMRATVPVSKADSSEPQPRPVSAPGSPPGVLNVAELPLPIQQQMPKISVSGFAHSPESGARVAIVNHRMLGEGDEVLAGLKVEQILRDGVIFSYKGYRFRSE
jgi:general secretion pathway protein B